MSRGLGKMQRSVLEKLEERDRAEEEDRFKWRDVSVIAMDIQGILEENGDIPSDWKERLKVPLYKGVLRAVTTLEKRGLVETKYGAYYQGAGFSRGGGYPVRYKLAKLSVDSSMEPLKREHL